MKGEYSATKLNGFDEKEDYLSSPEVIDLTERTAAIAKKMLISRYQLSHNDGVSSY